MTNESSKQLIRNIIFFAVADLIVDSISLGITAFGFLYFAKRTVPTPNLEVQKTLQRERDQVDRMRTKQVSDESSILLRSGKISEQQKEIEYLKTENTRLRAQLSMGGHEL